MLATKIVLLSAILVQFGLISAQDQCDPSQYAACGTAIQQLGYAATCNQKAECRDCIGCNQACMSFPCQPSITCSATDYRDAGGFIVENKNSLGWLKLCCDSPKTSKKCVGCQEANVFNILCGYTYPSLAASLGLSAQSAPLNPDFAEMVQSSGNADSTLMFGVEFMGIGAIIGILLTLVPIATIYCLCSRRRARHQYSKVSCVDSEAEDAQRLRV